MTFPVYLRLGWFTVSAHAFFEALAYAVGFRVYLAQRKSRGDVISTPDRWSVIAAAAIGAALGSRILFWFEKPAVTLAHWNSLNYLLSGKTIVGGLLGGLIAVELLKKVIGVRTATGDLFAVPLCVAMAIGRVGCFLAGVADDTAGVATKLPWGIDFGDHVRRHPTQIYEILFLLTLAVALLCFERRPHAEGDVFKLFLFCYLFMRLLIDAVKPEVLVLAGFSSIQLACVAGILYYLPKAKRILECQTKQPFAGA